MKKYLKYSFMGFLAGAAVTLLCGMLIFLALGAVGLSTPMMTVIGGIFMPLGAAGGFCLSINEDPDCSRKLLYVPLIAYGAGAAAMVIMNALYPVRSFYLGLLGMYLTVGAVFFWVYKRQQLRDSLLAHKVFRNYLLTGILWTLFLVVTTWKLGVFVGGLTVTGAGAFTMKNKLKPVKIIAPVARPGEKIITEYLQPAPIKESVKPVRMKKSRFKLRLFIYLLITALLGVLAYILYPTVTADLWKYIGLIVAVAFFGLTSGSLIGRVTGRQEVKNVKG